MTTPTKPVDAVWTQGLASNGRHWVHIPGLARGINAGTPERAARIVHSVNAHPALVAALEQMVDDVLSESFLFPGGSGVSEDTLRQAQEILAAIAPPPAPAAVPDMRAALSAFEQQIATIGHPFIGDTEYAKGYRAAWQRLTRAAAELAATPPPEPTPAPTAAVEVERDQ